jgi:hypothetical protein
METKSENNIRYKDLLKIPKSFAANMTKDAMEDTPEMFFQFFPHKKYIEFIDALLNKLINNSNKSIWLTGNLGTGKSHAALVTQILFMDKEERVDKWFTNNVKGCDSVKLNSIKNTLKGLRPKTLVVYDYDANSISRTDSNACRDLIVRLEKTIIAELIKRGYKVPLTSNIEITLNRIDEEGEIFFKIRDELQGQLKFLTSNIKTGKELREKVNSNSDFYGLLNDIETVLHHRSVYLSLEPSSFLEWIKNIYTQNPSIERIVYLFDEFSTYIDRHVANLKTFENISENPGSGSKFYFVPITHMQILAYQKEDGGNVKFSNDRFDFFNLQMPNDVALRIIAHAITPNNFEEWEIIKNDLWDLVKDIHFSYFSQDDVGKDSFKDIMPIHPMAAFLLKSLAEHVRSNQRSIFEYLKGNEKDNEFSSFLKDGGPKIRGKKFLTVDYLWNYFINRDDLGQGSEIIAIKTEYMYIRGSYFPSRDDDDEILIVLKVSFLFHLLSKLLGNSSHKRLQPTVENIKLSFAGDGRCVNVDELIKELVDKHCLDNIEGKISVFSSNIGLEILNAEIEKNKDIFNEEIAKPTEEKIKELIKKTHLSKYSESRFTIYATDTSKLLFSGNNKIQNQFKMMSDEDDCSVCLWFVISKDKKEKIDGIKKIRSLLAHYKDYRLILFDFVDLTFCKDQMDLWDKYVKYYSSSNLQKKSKAERNYTDICKNIKEEWLKKITNQTKIKYYTSENFDLTANDSDKIVLTDGDYNEISFSSLHDIINTYFKIKLKNCIDLLAPSATIANKNLFLSKYAKAGIVFDLDSLITLKFPKQFTTPVTHFKQALKIEADDNWFSKNSNHTISKIKNEFDLQISEIVETGNKLAVSSIIEKLKKYPYGLTQNGFSAFVVGVALRHILKKKYRWDNNVLTGVLDDNKLAEIIANAFKLSPEEIFICKRTQEEEKFIKYVPQLFEATKDYLENDRVEDVLILIENQLKSKSNKIPLLILVEHIRNANNNDPDIKVISEIMENICNACSQSSKNEKDEDRSKSIKTIGGILAKYNDIQNLTTKINNYIKFEVFLEALWTYVDSKSEDLVRLASNVGDTSHSYCNSIIGKLPDNAVLLYTLKDVDIAIKETILEYNLIKILQKLSGSTDFCDIKTLISKINTEIKNSIKLPAILVKSEIPEFYSFFLTNEENTFNKEEFVEFLNSNFDMIKALCFDSSKKKVLEILKKKLCNVSINDDDLLNIYNDLKINSEKNESDFFKAVNLEIDKLHKNSISNKLIEEWKRITSSDSILSWTTKNNIPTEYAFEKTPDRSDIVSALKLPTNFSNDRLDQLLNILRTTDHILEIETCQKRFLDERIPKKYSKLNINFSQLVKFYTTKYKENPKNNHPDEWEFVKEDIDDLIKEQYKTEFAPQIIKKIDKIPDGYLKLQIKDLVEKHPEFGLLILEKYNEIQ